jgi:CopG antitoxin of type II toxin-antitoxin system
MRKRSEPIPTFESEAEERRFWESHDSTDHLDWSRAERVRLPSLRPRRHRSRFACR